MDKFDRLEGVAAPMKMINVDTDMIIPKQYLKTVKRTGLGKGLFAEKRYLDDGSENPDFVLNKPAYRNAKILVADDNFGCGSSREHAPWRCSTSAFAALSPPRSATFSTTTASKTACCRSGFRRKIWRSCSTMPTAAPTPRSASTLRPRKSAAGRRRREIRDRCVPQALHAEWPR